MSLEKGGNRIIGRTITAGDYNVRYNNTGSGLIVYNFQRKAPEPDEVPVYVPANERRLIETKRSTLLKKQRLTRAGVGLQQKLVERY